jgi:hypothetical protein
MNRPKRKLRRQAIAQLRALFVSITSISLAIVGGALGILATSPSFGISIGVFLVIVGLAGIGYLATYQLFKLDYEEKLIEQAEASNEIQEQVEKLENAVKRGMQAALAEILQSGTLDEILKNTVQQAVREELAHHNLADKDVDTSLTEDIDDSDIENTSQQNELPK